MGHQQTIKMTGAILDIGILIGIRLPSLTGSIFALNNAYLRVPLYCQDLAQNIYWHSWPESQFFYLFQLLCLSKFFYLFFIFTLCSTLAIFTPKSTVREVLFITQTQQWYLSSRYGVYFYPWAGVLHCVPGFYSFVTPLFYCFVCFDDEIS